MKRARSNVAICGLALGAWLAGVSACDRTRDTRTTAPARVAAHAQARSGDCDEQPVTARLESTPAAGVILSLRESASDDLAQLQQRVLSDLGDGFRVTRQYASVAALAGELTRAGFDRARVHPDIRCIQLDGTGSGTPAL